MSGNLYVRVVDGEVKDCWDTVPAEGVGNNGWMNAVEVRPEIIANRQGYTAHTFDTTKDPVEIVYGTFDISVADRQNGMAQSVEFQFQQYARAQLLNAITYDADAVAALKAAMPGKIATIRAATTHDELDALMSTVAPIPV
jgi:hypothetical protein